MNPQNPIGFSAIDFIALACAGLLVSVLLAWPRIEPYYNALARSTRWSMLFLATLPLVLRLALLVHCPVPIPSGSDDFAYVLLGDTLAHFRMANPPHALSQFFETPFVLQQPTYSSIYPLGQGIVLAIGQILFHSQWVGVLLSVSALCALCYWMLRGWTAPEWALLGGLLAVIEFGPLSYWANSYWGGAVAACGGCLVFGALPRLREAVRLRYGFALGTGIAISLLTRPFESVLLLASLGLYLVAYAPSSVSRAALRTASVIALSVLPALCLMLLQNRAVTGKWTESPYQASRYQYGVPATFTFQPNPAPHRQLTRDQELDYRAQVVVHGTGPDTAARYFGRLAGRVRFFRFFLLAPLYIAFAAFLITAFRSRETIWILATLLIFALGSNLYPYFYPHYIAAVSCLFLLAAILGLQRIKIRYLAHAIVIVCAAHFLFWYGLHLLANDRIASAMTKYDTWDYIDFGDPEGRFAIARQLSQEPEKQLVFVHYGPRHMFRNWIHNAADIDGAHVVWARDLGPAENGKLLRYYPGRTAWIVDPDAWPPALKPYRGESGLGLAVR